MDPDGTTSDATVSDEIISDEIISDETTSDETISDETISDEMISDEMISDETTSDETFIDKAQCSRTLQEYSIDWQEVASFKSGGNTQTSTPKEDARATLPQSESELQALQLAIRPTFDDFTYITRREPEIPNPWLSYNDQIDDIQKQLAKFLKDTGCEENIWLPRLEPWNGGLDSGEIWKKIQLRVPARETFDRLDSFQRKPRKRRGKVSLQWCRDNEVPKIAAKMQAELELPPLIRPLRGDPSVDNSQEAHLNQLVANDGAAYKRWLNAVGLTIYDNELWDAEGQQTWDYWCRYIAPSVFVLHGRQSKQKPMVKRTCGPAVEMVQRPVISLEEARRGSRAWKMPRGGHRVSIEGAAFLPAIKCTNPVLAGREKDLKYYGVGRAKQEYTNDMDAGVKHKRKFVPEGLTKPVKRIHFADVKAPTPPAKEKEFIEPGLTES